MNILYTTHYTDFKINAGVNFCMYNEGRGINVKFWTTRLAFGKVGKQGNAYIALVLSTRKSLRCARKRSDPSSWLGLVVKWTHVSTTIPFTRIALFERRTLRGRPAAGWKWVFPTATRPSSKPWWRIWKKRKEIKYNVYNKKNLL